MVNSRSGTTYETQPGSFEPHRARAQAANGEDRRRTGYGVPGETGLVFKLARRIEVVDEVALYRLVGSAEVMAEQCRHLAKVAGLPNVVLQVMPLVAHAVNNSGIMLADTAAWVEHAAAGYVFTDDQTVSSLTLRLDTLRAEARTASGSLKLLNRMAETWDRLGESQRTQTRPEATASK